MPTFGKVIGKFVTPVVDSMDPDTYPDLVPLVGTITFLSVADRLIDPSASPDPVVMASTPIVAVLDANGYLSTPGPSNTIQYKGMWLVASDDPELNPTNNQYVVTYSLSLEGKVVQLPSHRLFIAGGSTIDLGAVIPPAAVEPIGIAQAEAAAASAAASAAEAVAQLGGLTLQLITQAAYDLLPSPRPNDILYVITP